MTADRSTRPRTDHLADTPTFSLVVTSLGDPGALRALLAGVRPLCAAHGVQVVVVRAGPAVEAPALADEHPGTRVLHLRDDASPGALRSAGMAAAEGDVVLFAADDDPDAGARLLHLLRSHGVLAPGAGDRIPGPAGTGGAPLQTPTDHHRPAGRQDLPTRDALEASECHSRPPHRRAARTGSLRETGSSSSVPAPAG